MKAHPGQQTSLEQPTERRVAWTRSVSIGRIDWRWGLAIGCLAIGVGYAVAMPGGGFLSLILGLIASALLVLVLDSAQAQVIAIGALFVVPLFNVVPVFRPQDNNFYLYAALMLLVVGIKAAARSARGVGLIGVFVIWFLGMGIYSTIVLKPVPLYQHLTLPLGALGVYMVLSYGEQVSKRVFFRGFLIWSGIEAGIGLLQATVNLPLQSWSSQVYGEARNYIGYIVPGISTRVRMSTGTFDHFNLLAALLSMALPIALVMWLEKKSMARGLYLALIAAGLVSTFSRGGFLGGCVGALLVYLALPRHSILHHLRIWVGVLGAIVSAIVLEQAIAEYVSATQNAIVRVATWSRAISYSLQDPFRLVFGSGLGYYTDAFLRLQAGVAAQLHSAPIELLVETGVVGLALGTVIFVGVCVRGLRSKVPSSIGLGGALAAFMVSQLFDNAFFTMTGVVVVGLLTVLDAETRNAKPETLSRGAETSRPAADPYAAPQAEDVGGDTGKAMGTKAG